MADDNRLIAAAPETGKVDGDAAGEIPGEVRNEFPCSVAQERFWLLDRLEPGNASYNVAVRWRLEGTVRSDLLEQAWARIIERHEILRTVFSEKDGAPLQRVLPKSQFRLTEIDLGALPEEARQAEGDRIGVIEARAPFDVGTGPLVRATLLRYSPGVAVILVTTHQIVSDGWSIGVMAREMGEIYRALCSGQLEPLEELPLQYADYSLWQLEWLRARGTEAETAYWTRQLAGVHPFKVLPDHPRPAVPTTNGAIASIVLPRELTTRAQALSAAHGTTLFSTALSALTAMLARYTGETEIVLGTQVSDRDQVELEGMVGQFVNSLILRNDLSGDPAFGALIERSHETIQQALEHRHIPIERLLGMVRAERGGTHAALISVNFIFQRTFIQNADYGDFRLVDMPSLPAGAIYDLNFFMVERPDGWRFSVQYNTDQFEADTANRLLRYVQAVLGCAVDDDRQRLSQLVLIDAVEREQLLEVGQGETLDYPRDATLADLFEAQAAQRPEAIAVVAGEQQRSYRQLEERANQLAHHFLASGVARGQRVGVCVERGADLPATLLALSKIGAAWVLLDPADSSQRLARLAGLVSLSALIASDANQLRTPVEGLRRIDLDAAAVEIDRGPAHRPTATRSADDEACVGLVAASGVGPDGLVISQAALVARLCGLRVSPGLKSDDVLLAITPATLDAALLELLLPLVSGARLVIAAPRDCADGVRLLQLLKRAEVTVLHALPSVWASLLGAGAQGRLPVRALLSGEVHDRRLEARLLERCAEIWTLHPCAEATICVAAHRVQAPEGLNLLGRPLANTRLLLLDEAGQLVPTGAPGELCVAGDGLATRYLAPVDVGRPAFADVPIAMVPGARLFRTGERVRRRAGGEIEMLGRRDAQRTVAGYRVMPGDLEALLLKQPGVAEAAVIVGDDAGENPRIDVYLGAPGASGAEALATAVRGLLAETLPALLQPIRLKLLEALPRRADGRLDEAALRVRTGDDAPASVPATPAGETECRLLALWSAMLGRSDFDVLANFFELGGHSLLAARMLGRVEAEFGRRVSLAGLFRAPNIRELAQLIERHDYRSFDFRQVVRLQAMGSRPPIIGINNTGVYYLLAKRLGTEQPFTSLQLFDPSVRSEQMPKTLEEIAAGYVALIRRVQPTGPYSLIGWCVAGALAFEVARQLDERHGEVAQLYLMDAWIPNYMKRLPWPRSWIAEYSLRWQFIVADWRYARVNKLGLRNFLDKRALVKRLRKLFGKATPEAVVDPENRQVTPDDYDQWLLGYLQRLTANYQPKPFRGQITLFRSRREPTGWWFDPLAGWGALARGGVDLYIVDGDHFTMFQDPGVMMIANRMNALIDERLTTGDEAARAA